MATCLTRGGRARAAARAAASCYLTGGVKWLSYLCATLRVVSNSDLAPLRTYGWCQIAILPFRYLTSGVDLSLVRRVRVHAKVTPPTISST